MHMGSDFDTIGLALFCNSQFMLIILPDDEIAECINSLNSTQREVFNLVHTWTKDYAKYNGDNITKPVHIFPAVVGARVNRIR